ncbi:hypothetical protein Pelo_8539 [Pelomyxa schiedti]|nr:hypothetical protein Pelo_8539 [Pelomyxa schiedti]
MSRIRGVSKQYISTKHQFRKDYTALPCSKWRQLIILFPPPGISGLQQPKNISQLNSHHQKMAPKLPPPNAPCLALPCSKWLPNAPTTTLPPTADTLQMLLQMRLALLQMLPHCCIHQLQMLHPALQMLHSAHSNSAPIYMHLASPLCAIERWLVGEPLHPHKNPKFSFLGNSQTILGKLRNQLGATS